GRCRRTACRATDGQRQAVLRHLPLPGRPVAGQGAGQAPGADREEPDGHRRPDRARADRLPAAVGALLLGPPPGADAGPAVGGPAADNPAGAPPAVATDPMTETADVSTPPKVPPWPSGPEGFGDDDRA